jgi:hypothetical protein
MLSSISFAEITLVFEVFKSNGPLGGGMGAPTDTGTTTEANEPFEVDDDVSHEASENKEQGKFQSSWSSLYTWRREK